MFKKFTENKKLTVVIRLIVLLAVFGSTLLILDRILLLKSKDGISQMQAFYKQPENSVDALFVGSSHIFCHVNTGILWDEYGIAGYDLAAAEQFPQPSGNGQRGIDVSGRTAAGKQKSHRWASPFFLYILRLSRGAQHDPQLRELKDQRRAAVAEHGQ